MAASSRAIGGSTGNSEVNSASEPESARSSSDEGGAFLGRRVRRAAELVDGKFDRGVGGELRIPLRGGPQRAAGWSNMALECSLP